MRITSNIDAPLEAINLLLYYNIVNKRSHHIQQEDLEIMILIKKEKRVSTIDFINNSKF